MNEQPQEAGSDLVLFRKCADTIEASALRALLEANGVYCVVQGEQHRSLYGTLGAFIEVNVLVPQEDLDRAVTLVAEAEQTGANDQLLPWGNHDLGQHGVQPENLTDDVVQPRSNNRRAKGWMVIGIFAGPVLAAIFAALVHRWG